MTTVLIQPTGPRDQAMHKDQYEALRAALEAEGYSATVDIGMEQRSGVQVARDVVLHIGEDAVAGAIVTFVKHYLRNFRRPPAPDGKRTATIYGPKGDVLSVVELEDDED